MIQVLAILPMFRLASRMGYMLYACIDESYLAGNVYIIGALVLTQRQVDVVTTGLDDVIWKTNKKHSEVELNAEFHGQQLFQRDGDWKCLREKVSVAYGMYRNAVSKIAMSEGKWFIGGVRRIDRLADRYEDPWPPHQIALQYALEKVHEYAHKVGERVTVIADRVPDQDHHEARIKAFKVGGKTPGWRASTLASLDLPFEWADSRDHRGLQAADMLTYIYLRKRFDADEHARSRVETERIAEIARPILAGQHVWTP